MIKCFLILGLVLLTGGSEITSRISSRHTRSFVTASLNEYVDASLPSVISYMVENGLDPMPLPDMLEGFSVKPLWIEYHGELELTKGTLGNLRSLQRVGDTIVSYGNKILKVRGDFGATDLGFTFDYLAKIMNIGPTGGVKGSVSKASMVVDFLIDFNSNEIQLQEFYMHDMGSINIKLTGHILTDLIANAMSKVITTLFKNVIFNFVEKRIEKEIQTRIDLINSSMGGATGFLEGMNLKMI